MAEQSILSDDDFLLEDDIFSERAFSKPDTHNHKLKNNNFFQQLPVQVTLELASAEMSLGELNRMGEGDVIALDRMVGEPLDIRVNGALLGRGEVVEVAGRYGVRLLEIESITLDGTSNE
ncbi:MULTISPECIES: FliM/FliN family flagellar motor switch protein [unclassified Shewanella]|uniref:FliM/FliN family flagellar motor switch protein n=1 Tax=Shewanella TaxID=22 RepID=UPI0021D85831|nr:MULTISPECIES: FliM/FliN family flagellar motor switch protein [unclassified Shewanella]MCU8045316.1 FliM/FliN family flagellar motor switch protein [Shewanella sp. SM68]MCU8049602.1 FliM/FliN family flagellar motor switch protein [Shewanella sp. SM65]MCU8092269.1 FliM/FliN family flagellar motor switch protein [Shewanella sp. SM20]